MLIFLLVMSEDDSDLVNELFSQYNIELYKISMSMVHNKDTAEEAVQDAFLSIINNIEKIKRIPRPDMVKFCVVVVKNATIDIVRKNKKLTTLDDLSYFADEQSDFDLEGEIIQGEEKATLLKKMKELPYADRQLIRLRWGHNLSFAKIAELLGISTDLANKRTQRAVKKLRNLYNTKEGVR